MHHVRPDQDILDFGCGYGRVAAQLAEFGYTSIVGVDFSETLIARGKQDFPHLDLRHSPSLPLPFEDATFDAVMLAAVLTCIPGDTDQRVLITELKRVLKPDGAIYVNDFLLNRDKRNLDRYADGAQKYETYGTFDLPDGGVVRHFDKDHIHHLFEDWEELYFESTVFPTMHGNISNGFMALYRNG